MPNRALRPCAHIGCKALVRSGYCDKHKKDTRTYDNNRESAAQRGYDSDWRRYRISYLKAHPLCVECLKEGTVTLAKIVDHIVPHKGDYKLFWDPKNHQPLCKKHHDRKTASEDGGFGNTPRGV